MSSTMTIGTLDGPVNGVSVASPVEKTARVDPVPTLFIAKGLSAALIAAVLLLLTQVEKGKNDSLIEKGTVGAPAEKKQK